MSEIESSESQPLLLHEWIAETLKRTREIRAHFERLDSPSRNALVEAVDFMELATEALRTALRRSEDQATGFKSPSYASATSKTESNRDITFQPIGWVKNVFEEPTSPERIRSARSDIVIRPDLIIGLKGLEPGSRILVIFHFHRSSGYELLQHPRGDRTRARRGVFTLRSPNRPNPIGVTEVELVKQKDNVLTVRGLDAIDGTPVLDLKPA
jgi:tRNA-Thr(GGU) m(6)t(6)A37 methyltransferase TsaA